METKNNNLSMTTGNLWSSVLKFALPLALTGILQQLFNAADTAIVGKFTGDMASVAMAAVGANSPLISFAINLFVGLSLGANVVIANSIGRNDLTSVSKAAHSSIVFALSVGALIAVAAQFIAPFLFSHLDVPDEVVPLAVTYFRIYMGGLPVIVLYNFEAAILRGTGDTRTPLLALFISGIVNVLLNLYFVCVLHFTVEGVAIATVVANLISSTILLVFLMKSRGYVKLVPSKLRIDWKIIAKVLRIGVPAALQSSVFGIANIIIQSAINSLGTVVMAASSAAYNIELFAYYVLNSFSQACTTFVGQNYGAGRPDRCRKTLKVCFIEGVTATVLSIVLILSFGRNLLSLFNDDPEVIRTGYIRLMVIFSAYVFTLSYELMAGYLRGFGISLIPSVLTMVGICATRITWIMTVFKIHKSLGFIMAAYPVSLSTTALLLLIALLIIKPSRGHKTE